MAYLLLLPVLIVVTILLSHWHEDTIGERLSLLKDDDMVFQITLAVVAFTLVPICEEIFFRGFIFNVLKKRLAVPFALFLQAVLFGMLHPYTPTYPIFIFWVGLGLGIVYQWRKRLLAPIVTHACFNSVGGAMILATTLLNAHKPATTWDEAKGVLEPPAWLVAQVEIAVDEMGTEEVANLIEDAFGEEGLGVWKVETLFSVALADVLGEGDEKGAQVLLRAASLYETHEDPRRAALLALKIQEAFPGSGLFLSQAEELYSRVTASLGEEPPFERSEPIE